MSIDIEKLREYIDENLRRTLGLKEIANAVKCHPADVDRAFRNFYGVTVKKYIDMRLMEELKSQSLDDSVPGYIVGRKLGFLSGHPFYRWVKRVCGGPYRDLVTEFANESMDTEDLTPTTNVEWRNRNKEPGQHPTPTKTHQESAPRNDTKNLRQKMALDRD